MIGIKNVSKEYRLGVIGGGTLQGDIQSWWAKIHGKEDPNSKIGAKSYGKNEKFLALDDISFSVKKGERVGIIGHNGAGKSTLLKLLSRVTAPTDGYIGLNGRISSMLEVGTGFHGELTGRENIYMNGAILGMSRAEIDSKMDQIIAFSECGQFIDTPVKRYSSGMYVKLAFAVAAHLDSEILVMDEVLAVGDMKFQEKCLGKMDDVSKTEGRTILYVSHNMNTIRQLCTRCIVLEHGRLVFDGKVEDAIAIYLGKNNQFQIENTFCTYDSLSSEYKVKLMSLRILNSDDGIFTTGDKIRFKMAYQSVASIENVMFRMVITDNMYVPVAVSFSEFFSLKEGINQLEFEFDTKGLAPEKYNSRVIVSMDNGLGAVDRLDIIEYTMSFTLEPSNGFCNNIEWNTKSWGYFRCMDIQQNRSEEVV